MSKLLRSLSVWGLLEGLVALSLISPASAANSDATKPEASTTPSADAQKPGSKPEAPAQGEAAKPEAPKSDAPEKPAEAAAPKSGDGEEASVAGVEKGGLKMQELLAEGFQIKTTVLVPAEIVTRQTGKVSPDALMTDGDATEGKRHRGLLLHAQILRKTSSRRVGDLQHVPLGGGVRIGSAGSRRKEDKSHECPPPRRRSA
jgi:hypothetical protein